MILLNNQVSTKGVTNALARRDLRLNTQRSLSTADGGSLALLRIAVLLDFLHQQHLCVAKGSREKNRPFESHHAKLTPAFYFLPGGS